MLTDNEYVLIKRMYNMTADMVNSLNKITGLATTSEFKPVPVVKDELLKHELIKYSIELEHIKIRFGKILNGTAGY
jgi:hypothetical protein